MQELAEFIVAAKAACYVGDGAAAKSCRLGSHDLGFARADWRYLDSYFGGTDFLGQEVVWHQNEPVWAMNYYGNILRDDLIDAQRAGAVIKQSLAALYGQGRFLGGFEHRVEDFVYLDENSGDVGNFRGLERILLGDTEVYRLDYHGGNIRP